MSMLVWFLKRLLNSYKERTENLEDAIGTLEEDYRAEIDGVDDDIERLTEQNRKRIDKTRSWASDEFARKRTVDVIRKDFRELKKSMNNRFDELFSYLQD
jgi:predicted  nucleic acid-binding Zn-ribbon protein